MLTHGVFYSLLGNTLGLWVGSLSGGERPIDRIQANAFFGAASAVGSDSVAAKRAIATVGDFINLTRRFLGEQRTRQTFGDYAARTGPIAWRKAGRPMPNWSVIPSGCCPG